MTPANDFPPAGRDARQLAPMGYRSPAHALLCELIDAGLALGLFELHPAALVNGRLNVQQVTDAAGRSFSLIVAEDPGPPPATPPANLRYWPKP